MHLAGDTIFGSSVFEAGQRTVYFLQLALKEKVVVVGLRLIAADTLNLPKLALHCQVTSRATVEEGILVTRLRADHLPLRWWFKF